MRMSGSGKPKIRNLFPILWKNMEIRNGFLVPWGRCQHATRLTVAENNFSATNVKQTQPLTDGWQFQQGRSTGRTGSPQTEECPSQFTSASEFYAGLRRTRNAWKFPHLDQRFRSKNTTEKVGHRHWISYRRNCIRGYGDHRLTYIFKVPLNGLPSRPNFSRQNLSTTRLCI